MDTLKSGVTLLVALIVIAAGGILVAFLFMNVGVVEATWQRYTYLLSGVEAVVFAAVGWLFGKEVHREQAAAAERDRKESDAKKDKAIADAASAETKGRELAMAVIAAAGGQERAQSLALEEGGGTPMATLVRLARSSFPDA